MERHPILSKVASWQTVFGGVVGALIVVFFVYPPAPNWGSNEKWGDVGTWFGSITTGVTAIAATWIAGMERRERMRRDLRRSVLLSMELTQPIIRLKSEVNSARRCLRRPYKTVSEIGYKNFQEMVRLPSSGKFPRGVVLEDISEGLATGLAELARHCVMYEQLVDLADASISEVETITADIVDSEFDFIGILDYVQRSLAKVVNAVNDLGGPQITTDVLDKGDGTRLP